MMLSDSELPSGTFASIRFGIDNKKSCNSACTLSNLFFFVFKSSENFDASSLALEKSFLSFCNFPIWKIFFYRFKITVITNMITKS